MRLAILLLGLTPLIHAQIVGGSISGTVRDASGAALPGASVSLKNSETGAERKLLTDDAGRYSAPSLAVGRYEIRAEKAGFAPQVKSGVAIEVGQHRAVDLELAIGAYSQVVTVTEHPNVVSVSTQSSAGLVTEQQVKELPLNGRSYDGLMAMNPAVVNYTQGRSGGVGTSNSSLGSMFAVAGRRPQENLYLLNGIEYTGASVINVTPGGASGQLLGVDAVREFNVVSDTYGAEYGKRPGGQVSIVTASGTNQLHGSAYEFLRNSALDARNFFDQGSIPGFERNQFGTAIGGPIRRDKLFIFGNYEGFRQRLGLSDVTLVPDGASRASAVPSVAPLLALWPVANGPSLGGGIAEAFSHPLQSIREDFGTVRLDYNASVNDAISAVYTIDDSADVTPSANPLSTAIENLREQVASLQEQHVFSATLLNTARIGYSRAAFFFTGTTPVNLPGWVVGDPIGAIVIGGGTALNGASSLSPAGTNAGSNLSMARNLVTYDDHLAWTKGRHQIEAGVWAQRLQSNDDMAQDQYGQASFSSLATFLQGTIATFTVAPAPTPVGWRQTEFAGFAQDAIRLAPDLEIRAGIRVESDNGWNESHGRAANFAFNGGVMQTNPVIGNSVYSVNRAKFLPEPRVGLAWDPFGKSATVIHAGFGIYRALLDNVDYRVDQTAPFNTTESLKNAPVEGLQIVSGAPLPAGTKISPSGIQPDAYTPTVLSWSAKVEQRLSANASLAIGYIGSHGYHEMLSVDANEPVATICPAAPCPASLSAGTLYYPTGAGLANPALANTTTWLSEGVSSYQGLQVDFTRRLARGFQIRAVYTFSKSLDDGTAWNSSVGGNAPGFVMYPANPKLDWSASTSDVKHVAVINALYELPFHHGKLAHGKLAQGWSLAAIETLQSGLPFTPSLGFNPSNNGDSRNPVRPSWNPAFAGNVIAGSPNEWFHPNAFVAPVSGTYGNVGRDPLRGPGLAELDFSVLKSTPLTDRTRLQFRAEFFNLFNRANFGIPNTVVYTAANTGPSPTAGVITATATTSRQIQFGLKLVF